MSGLPTPYTTTVRDASGHTETSVVLYYTAVVGSGSTITVVTTGRLCSNVPKSTNYVTTVTNTIGGTKTFTLTVPCETTTNVNSAGERKTMVISGVITTNPAGSVVVSPVTSEIHVTTVIGTVAGTRYTATVTVPCAQANTYTTIESEGTTVVTGTVTYYPTTNSKGSITATSVIVGTTTSVGGVASALASTVPATAVPATTVPVVTVLAQGTGSSLKIQYLLFSFVSMVLVALF